MSEYYMDQLETLKQIEQDFEKQRAPFDNVEFPESRLIRELDAENASMEKRARIVTIFCTFDYNRNANQLVDKLVELHERDANLFDPWFVTDHSDEEVFLEEHFEEIGFRYPSRDARGWYRNCEILRNKYSGRVTELMLSVSSSAPELVEQLRDDGFLYLKGDKIAPMYARILSDEVAPLNDMWELDIPVDTHIARLTQELTNTEMSNDDVRAWWQVVGERADISRHIVDGGIWMIGNNWNEWGEDYWERVTIEL